MDFNTIIIWCNHIAEPTYALQNHLCSLIQVMLPFTQITVNSIGVQNYSVMTSVLLHVVLNLVHYVVNNIIEFEVEPFFVLRLFHHVMICFSQGLYGVVYGSACNYFKPLMYPILQSYDLVNHTFTNKHFILQDQMFLYNSIHTTI